MDLNIDFLEQDINTDFKENYPHVEGVTPEYTKAREVIFQEPPEFHNLLDTCKLVLKPLPKHANIDKVLK